MIRRDFIKLIITSLASHPIAAMAQRSIPVIGALSPNSHTVLDSGFYAGFSQGMRELGYAEGKDYLIEWRFAEGDYTRLSALANELVALKVNVLFATSSPSILAAHAATTTIPIVMGYFEGDPTEQGLAASLARPTGNVTGLATMQLEGDVIVRVEAGHWVDGDGRLKCSGNFPTSEKLALLHHEQSVSFAAPFPYRWHRGAVDTPRAVHRQRRW